MVPLIQATDLSKTFNPQQPDEIHALKSACLQINQAETIALQGPSGSGKTTLLSLLGCMARPTSGNLQVVGKNVAKLPEPFLTQIRRESFGFIFQQFNLIRTLKVIDNILLPLYPTNLSGRQMHERADAILTQLDISDKRQQLVSRLSGGEQQRVAIARALINQPHIIIADEPTAHLDRQLSAELLEIFTKLKQAGKTIIIASHDPFIYQHPLVDRCFSMHDGCLIEAPR